MGILTGIDKLASVVEQIYLSIGTSISGFWESVYTILLFVIFVFAFVGIQLFIFGQIVLFFTGLWKGKAYLEGVGIIPTNKKASVVTGIKM